MLCSAAYCLGLSPDRHLLGFTGGPPDLHISNDFAIAEGFYRVSEGTISMKYEAWVSWHYSTLAVGKRAAAVRKLSSL